MIELINGRGQLGEALKNEIYDLSWRLNSVYDTYIYHTWNVFDKTEDIQIEEYNKFKKFVDSYSNFRVIYISTSSENDTPYRRYKLLAEEYLMKNCENYLVVRLPILVGKGIIEKFKTGDATPFGNMELITIKKAAEKILEFVNDSELGKTINIEGEVISAELVYNIARI